MPQQTATDADRLLVQRHELADPEIETHFARLAAEHPERCTPSGDWTPEEVPQ